MWYVYMVRCSDNTLYTGITTDISKRIDAHNSRKGASYTRSRAPVRLVYKEVQSNRSAALRREAEIKRLKRSEKLSVISNMEQSISCRST